MIKEIEKGQKVIEMQGPQFAFITDLGKGVRVQKNKDDPTSEEERNVVNFIKKENNKYFIQFSTKRFLCAKEDDSGVVSCESETDKNTEWEIEPGKDDGVALKTKNGKCLHIGVYDERKRSKGLRLNMRDCNSKLDHTWRIRALKLDTEADSDSGPNQLSQNSSYYSRSVRTSSSRSFSSTRSFSRQSYTSLDTENPSIESIKSLVNKEIKKGELPQSTEHITVHLYYAKPEVEKIKIVKVPVKPTCIVKPPNCCKKGPK